jgi:protein involved in polysaccharide export with SLBB domain
MKTSEALWNSGWLPRLAAAACLLALVAGCKTTGPSFDLRAGRSGAVKAGSTNLFSSAANNVIKPEWLQPPTEPFRLGPGDRLDLEVLQSPGTRAAAFVGPDGRIYYDLLPGLDVWGLTLAETRALLERELARYYVKPQVSVTLTGVQSKRVWVLGRLNKSGVYPLTGPMTVIEAISRAGGLFTSRFGGTTEELADLNHSFIIRGGEMLPVNFQKLLRGGDTAQNIYLQPDDFIYLPSSLSSEVYVLGAVNGPRPIGYVDDMGLTAAISKALGAQPQAQLSHVAIVRGSLSNPKIAVVDFKAILNGRAPDVHLEPRDIDYVPFSPYRTLDRYAKLITDIFVRTVAANEGGRAVDKSFGGVGVSNTIGP